MGTRGEVAELKDNINTMIDNLRVTTERNKEQDWLKTNLAKFTRMLQGQRDLYTVGQMLLSELAPLVDSQQGTIYQMTSDGENPRLQLLASYANETELPEQVHLGTDLVGQSAKEKQRVLLTEVPPDYTPIHSSLGAARPANVVVLPVLYEGPLIIEDDPHYARVLLGLAHDKGFKGLVAMRGHEALTLARQYQPTAITLDIFLPDMLGWTVLNNLKLAPQTRHIPVQIITMEEERRHGLAHGAFSYLVKPATTEDLESAFDRITTFVAPRTKRLLVVEDNATERRSIAELFGHDDIEITTVATGEEAFQALLDRSFDCCVLDLRLPDMTGFDLLDRIQKEASLREVPIVVFTGKDLSMDEEARLRTMAKSIVLKDVQSPERLLDETSLFLHRVLADLPEGKQAMLQRLHNTNESLRGRKVLIVDDDARNIFALSTALENQEMEVLSATNGRQAIDLIKSHDELAIVLMDIMMPEMDGYETLREIRRLPEFRSLPILALTAKAMKGDREKCLEAGASDYIAKPVDIEQLLSLLRVWLHR